MEFDLEKVKTQLGERLRGIRQRYQERLNGAYVLGQQRRVERGVQAVEMLQGLIGEVSSKIDYSQRVMGGVSSLVRHQNGTAQEGDSEALETLTSRYYASGSFISRAVRRLRRKGMSIEEGLDILHETVVGLPPFVRKLHEEIKAREKDLYQLRTDLRGGIEQIIQSKPGLTVDKESLHQEIQRWKAEYAPLEEKRKSNSAQGKATEPKVLYQLAQLDGVLGNLQDEYSMLDAQERRADQNVDLLNANIEKVGKYLEMLNATKGVVADADNFVEIQVPYVMREIEAQKTEIQTLGGVDKVITFLDRQREVSQEINARISGATVYLAERVSEVREKCLTANIYPGLPARVGEDRMEETGFLTAPVVEQSPAEPQEVLVSAEKQE